MINLKSNKTLKEILEYKKAIQKLNFDHLEFVLFPSNIYLSFFYDAPYKIGSQNVSVYQEGCYTGEILASQLKSMKVSYTIVNHSEVNETTEDVIKKIKNATKENIKVVLCIGEETKKNEKETKEEILKKINQIFSKLNLTEKKNLVIAYEPWWAINKKVMANTEMISAMINYIREGLKEKYNIDLPILYGGSINTENIKKLAEEKNIDGYLIGNCANVPENVVEILKNV